MRNLTTLLLFLAFAVHTGAQAVDRVEPPHWWVGMHNPNLQLLVYGKDISNCTPSMDYAGVEILASHQGDNPNYLFIDLLISDDTAEGVFDITLTRRGEYHTSFTYTLMNREPGSKNRLGFNSSDVIYLITPDRFVNGEKNNDEVPGMQEGLNPNAEYGRHGGDLKGIADHLNYIRDMGFTALWLNPVLENDHAQWSYHGYSTTDYYKVDPRFGTNESYRDLCEKAASLGIKMIMDQIANHCGSEHWWIKDPPFPDWINYQDQPYTGSNHRRTTILDPYAAAEDREKMVKGWFVPTMPDLNQNNPFMATYLIQNSIWWIEYAGLGGIRQDTYPYPYKAFMSDWTCAIMDEYPRFNIVGEEWSPDQNVIAYWQRGNDNQDGYISCLPTAMDFPTNMTLPKALRDDENWNAGLITLYENLSKDHIYPAPHNLLVFPDNHDMSRIFTQLGEDYQLFKMALGYLCTIRGIPQILYGTEVLMSHPGTDSHDAIRSEFPGGWEHHQKNAFTGEGLSALEKEAQNFVRQLLQWRKNSSVVHNGNLIHYAPEDGFYVYFRYNEQGKVMVVLNKNKEKKSLGLDRFSNMIKNATVAHDVCNNKDINLDTTLEVPPRDILILELK